MQHKVATTQQEQLAVLSDERKLVSELDGRSCQTNANSSQYGNNMSILCSTKLLPLNKSSLTLNLKCISRIQMSFLVKVVENGRVNRDEFL